VDLLEHQGKTLFATAGLPVPAGKPALTADEAAGVAGELGPPVAVKAQVRTGGRGKAGGVRVCRTLDEVRTAAGEILAMTIRDRPVESVLVEQGVAIAHESYLAFVLSRHRRAPLLVCAAEGGVDVEELARTRPKAVLKMPVDPLLGLCDYQARDVAATAVAAAAQRAPDGRAPGGDAAATAKRVAAVVRALWRVYRDNDATLVEVNPLVVTETGGVICLDAKVTIDDNALWRQPDLAPLGPAPDERERRAREAGLSYITLDGDIGVIGNGAGLVMSTLDQLAAAGGRAANFGDVGGGASAASVALALELILSGAGVRALAVNIFGGITRGDQVAQGLIRALRATPAAAGVPAFVRLDGTAAEEGRALLAEARLPDLHSAGDVAELVRLACAARGGA
jgi:succinyl-CoA synthetase beta subunit